MTSKEALEELERINSKQNNGHGDIWLEMIIDGIKKDLDKLNQLEDIEEELGIDLITLFKALKGGIWCWNDKGHKEYFFEKPLGLTKFVMENKYDEKETETYRLVGVDYYELKDYGKTWALTKEELENEQRV